MSGKLEIQWSPIPNKFITWGSEICLYEVQPARGNFYSWSIDIYPKSETDLLLAIGLSNGRVALSTFGPSEYDTRGFPGKELVPRHGRQCNAVQYNPLDCHLIAAGLDKYRSDSSVLIWDINKFSMSSDSNSSGRLAVNTMAPAVELVRPVAEFGTSELTHSLTWFHGANRLLACGMNMKYIKIYDMRDPNKMINSTLTKGIFGVCVNPYGDRHLASFCDNQIFVWDLRNFEKPVLTLQQNKPILKIEWCPTNLLASLQKESSVINLYDIQHTIVGNEEVEPTVMERVVVPGSPHNITSFSWHNLDENRLLTIAVSGTIKDYTVFDRITLNWAPTSNIVWSHGRKTMKYASDMFLNDISNKMKERAKSRYGLQEDFYKNAKLVDNNEVLSNVWNWLHISSKLVDDGIIRGTSCRHPGIISIISKIDSNMNKSETVTITWAELGNPNCQGSARYYRHEDRDKTLHLCSWPLDRDQAALVKFLEQLEKEGAYTRAAAIAVFNLKVQLAIEILSRAPDNTQYGANLNVVAMALAGFSDDINSVWRQFCSTSRAKLTDPYLKAMFAFLTAENYNYDNVLSETGVTVDDRAAFACMFLPDNKLMDSIKRLSDRLCEEGNLDGLLLTGNSHDGLKILQKYLDVTGDIQSTALIAIRAFHAELGTQVVKDWIENYRHLLDTWKLFYERADFDIMLAQFKPNEKPPQQVYVSCNFCGKSISAYMHGLNRGRGQFQRMTGTANKVKMSSCPNCRKPLPRCAICLMHMGTTTGESDSLKLAEFDNWFTWCQTCRHGGHAGHMTQWFIEHQECPVTACTCRCFAVDAVASKY
ncbi:hypothetical protein NQ318_016083 [Aromia moschata]|uniref:WD repeat protein mio zinc-ribbon like domain-containing protein n=1 Tax=Aromia moschata TaxID=1265417 RepID=A0AAV8XJ49_9CUCU|nr:hypothetical protein NQ318_016083 [Aromia moschata]